MLFATLKILEQLVFPPAIIVALLIVALVFVRRGSRHGFRFLLVPTIALYLVSIEPTVLLIGSALEHAVPPASAETLTTATAIVILGAGASASSSLAPQGELSGASWRRLWRGIEVFRMLDGRIPILYIGGSGDPFARASLEAERARTIALTMGIPTDHFFIETESRDTYENGRALRRLLAEQFADVPLRVALVTSARHMPRATAVFRGFGVTGLAVPADVESDALRLDPLSFIPSASALALIVAEAHEWVGMASYALRGRL